MAERIKINETVMVLKEQNINQMKQLIELQNKNYDLEVELKTLKYESEKNQQTLSKFNDFELKFVKILTRLKASNDRIGIGYNIVKHKYKSRTTFVKSATKYRCAPTCFYCCKEEHLKFAFIIKNTFPFELHQ